MRRSPRPGRRAAAGSRLPPSCMQPPPPCKRRRRQAPPTAAHRLPQARLPQVRVARCARSAARVPFRGRGATASRPPKMYLMYYTNEKGERVYTLKVRRAARVQQAGGGAPCSSGAAGWSAAGGWGEQSEAPPPPSPSSARAVALGCRCAELLMPRCCRRRRAPALGRSHLAGPAAAAAAAQKVAPDGVPTQAAHPARFSPDDKFSRERTTCKKRFGLLPTQQPAHQY